MVERILDQSIVQGPEQQRPLPAHPPLGVPTHNVAKEHRLLAVLEFVAVLADESDWRGEAEPYEAPGQVLNDLVADRPVAPLVALAQTALKTHRRPTVVWPKTIVISCQAVDQRFSHRAIAGQRAFVHVLDPHVTAQLRKSDRQSRSRVPRRGACSTALHLRRN
jgi:hypothetical protein